MAENLLDKLQVDRQEIASLNDVNRYLNSVRNYQQRCPDKWQNPNIQTDSICSSLRSELDAASPAVEHQIQQQITNALIAQGIGIRLGPYHGLFPPVMFTFRAPPTLLVVSPRHRIELAGGVLLDPDLSLEDAERLETTVSAEDTSSMVTRIGGLGVYPSVLPKSSDLEWILQTVAHEWCHQFFAIHRLGWRYALGVETDQRMVTINETAAELIGKEIGDQVYRQDYGGASSERSNLSPRLLHFREQLRELRSQVDILLEERQIGEAEALMEKRRQELNAQGYSLRVLNQAYFAFNGNYAEDPYMSGPEGREISRRIQWLRAKTGSVGAFMMAIAGVGSYEDFVQMTGGQ